MKTNLSTWMKIPLILLLISACQKTENVPTRSDRMQRLDGISMELRGPLPNDVPGMAYEVTVLNPQQKPFCVGANSGLAPTVLLWNVKDKSSVEFGERPSTGPDVVLPGELDLKQKLSGQITDAVFVVKFIDGPFDQIHYLTQENAYKPFNFRDSVQAQAVAYIYNCSNKTVGQARKDLERAILVSKPSDAFRVEKDLLTK